MPSIAHVRSAFAIVDPEYSPDEPRPVVPHAAPTEAPWLYVPGEYECFMLRRLRDRAAAAGLNVNYPGEFHEPRGMAWFRRQVAAGERVDFAVSGAWVTSLVVEDNEDIVQRCPGPGAGSVTAASDGFLVIQVTAPAPGVLPGLRPGRTGRAAWEAADDAAAFRLAVPGGDPSGYQLPQVELAPARLPASGLPPAIAEAGGQYYDAGREVLAVVEVASPTAPAIAVGESLPEAASRDPEAQEQTTEMWEAEPGRWRSVAPLAFRYLRVEAAPGAAVRLHALYAPAAYRGAFAADDELTRIWMAAAHTARLCLHYFHIDGIKRDRLPWMGDLAISILANAYVFAQPAPVAHTLTALGRAGIAHEHVNGITDYSLWYLVCHDLYQRYFADRDFLRRQYPEIMALARALLHQAGDGYLPSGKWLFIDWVDGEKTTALQMLFHWALLAAARLSERMGDAESVGRLRARAAALRERLQKEAWDEGRKLFLAAPGESALGCTRHANLLAVLGGVATAGQTAAIAEGLLSPEMPPVGTPYMAALELLALHRGGKSEEAVAKLRTLWGGMLRQGATTFWEACDQGRTGDEKYAFYGRPFGCSLCHAWSAGPAAILPIIAMNSEPSADGWAPGDRPRPAPFAHDWAVCVPGGGEYAG